MRSSTRITALLSFARSTCLLSSEASAFQSIVVPLESPASTRLLGALSEPANSRFGRQDYWNDFYEKEANFSWYAGWDELEPFVGEFVSQDMHVLVPGVGNDATLVDMYDAGYSYLTAMDYAPEGIERCREMLGEHRLVTLCVADARDLQGVFDNEAFDAVLEKGTLDAIFLSGGQEKMKCLEHLEMAIDELGRCVKPGGIWISIAAVVVDQIQASFDGREEWEPIVRKDDLFITEDGYTSNNIDGTLLVWKKRM
jgi:SAM-dependent methyltransferase